MEVWADHLFLERTPLAMILDEYQSLLKARCDDDVGVGDVVAVDAGIAGDVLMDAETNMIER